MFELFNDLAPITCENFRALCTGEKGEGTLGKTLHYKGCAFFGIQPGFIIQSGDVVNNDGTSGESIYGPYFEDEVNIYKHIKAGTLSMAGKGQDKNNSQFLITLANEPLKRLDKKHVVFGRVAEGMNVVRSIERQGVKGGGKPLKKVEIAACGRLKKQDLQAMEEQKQKKKQQSVAQKSATPLPNVELKCEQCGTRLKYSKKIPKKKLVRFNCRNVDCGWGTYLPELKTAE